MRTDKSTNQSRMPQAVYKTSRTMQPDSDNQQKKGQQAGTASYKTGGATPDKIIEQGSDCHKAAKEHAKSSSQYN